LPLAGRRNRSARGASREIFILLFPSHQRTGSSHIRRYARWRIPLTSHSLICDLPRRRLHRHLLLLLRLHPSIWIARAARDPHSGEDEVEEEEERGEKKFLEAPLRLAWTTSGHARSDQQRGQRRCVQSDFLARCRRVSLPREGGGKRSFGCLQGRFFPPAGKGKRRHFAAISRPAEVSDLRWKPLLPAVTLEYYHNNNGRKLAKTRHGNDLFWWRQKVGKGHRGGRKPIFF